MPELSLAQAVSPVFDEAFASIFGPKRTRESDELAERIADETERALNSPAAWAQAHADVAASETADRLLQIARTGEDLEAGWRMIQAIRRQVITTATQLAHDKHNGDAR